MKEYYDGNYDYHSFEHAIKLLNEFLENSNSEDIDCLVYGIEHLKNLQKTIKPAKVLFERDKWFTLDDLAWHEITKAQKANHLESYSNFTKIREIICKNSEHWNFSVLYERIGQLQT